MLEYKIRQTREVTILDLSGRISVGEALAFGPGSGTVLSDVILIENWYSVMRAVRSCILRCRLELLTWQELAAVSPGTVQKFLAAKYGIVPSGRT